jgi:hypothetical protein
MISKQGADRDCIGPDWIGDLDADDQASSILIEDQAQTQRYAGRRGYRRSAVQIGCEGPLISRYGVLMEGSDERL